ncbi:MAG: glutathione S-transferase [Sulfitobacter sp.]|jgi:glutathione S-transferase|uniref:Glutathione S-transferase family protein n=1 Tax=Sulfitobacter profundi TaxID=2679961 RepID=A0ABW1YXK2_9RHOB|nr:MULTISPECIES: glutathione S-transferase [Sulfitobacter]HCQ58328.1 glutathione S-transferase [Sulfitobacter sp.]AYE84979.1 glutathione S-transferase [Sulfitobacter sp. D7]KZX98677.1 glutathione S-transferase [Sulfitobacter sp. HI0021]KZX99200.1 glutathione S-transferase [Sulfitobacter sp. HI0027]KZZ03545.1 glutathione S-transferase [Sulfitobacter sp. HI0076]|tara:strand:- start:594 stop:1187 length:594 start_codon:yes stop_codon:yes gene_type:complete
MYTVIGGTKSRAFRVMWMLEELGQPYALNPAAPRSEEARKYNPSGKIPALVDGDEVLTDSLAIMTYLADKHGALTAPAGTPERARQDALTFWLIDEFDAILWAAAKHSFIFPEEARVPAIKDSLKAEFERAAKNLSDRLEGPFLMGDQITVPDLLAVHCINWSIGAKFPRVDDKLNLWAKSLRERPAFVAAMAKENG